MHVWTNWQCHVALTHGYEASCFLRATYNLLASGHWPGRRTWTNLPAALESTIPDVSATMSAIRSKLPTEPPLETTNSTPCACRTVLVKSTTAELLLSLAAGAGPTAYTSAMDNPADRVLGYTWAFSKRTTVSCGSNCSQRRTFSIVWRCLADPPCSRKCGSRGALRQQY